MDWSPFAAHAPGCKRTGWDVRQHRVEHTGGHREIAIRAICSESGGCGLVFEFHVSLAPDRDPETEDLRSGEGWSTSGVERIGYGTKPQRVGDVWLHAGPPFAAFSWTEEEGPAWWYVTRSSTPPTDYKDTLGKVYRLRKAGRQLKGRVGAGAGWKPRTRYGGMHLVETREDLASVRVAARWVEQRAAELAAAAAAGGETA
jgi:hypothetical protein